MYKGGDLCPICETGYLHEERVKEELEWRGVKFSIEDLLIFTCDRCEESITSDEWDTKVAETIFRIFGE